MPNKPPSKLAQLVGDDLQKQQLRLDEREQSIAEKEAYVATALDEVAVQVAVAEKKLEAIHNTIERENEVFAKLQNKHKSELEDMAQTHHKLEQKIAKAQASLVAVESRAKDVQHGIDEKAQQLENLNAVIADREGYQQDQETQISMASDIKNEEFSKAQADLAKLQSEKEQLLRDIMEAKNHVKEANDQLDELNSQIGALDQRYQEAAANYRAALAGLKKDIDDASTKKQEIVNTTNEKLQKLDIKERELLTRERAQREIDEKQAQRERRLNSQERIYGIND